MTVKIIFQKDNVTVFQGSHGTVNSTMLEFENHLILIDTMYARPNLKELKQYIKEKNKPLKYIINTHYHFDHFWGNKFILGKDTIVIAHKNYLKTTLSRVRSQQEGEKLLKRNKYPDITFDQKLILEDEIELIYAPGHSTDGICVYLKNKKILITGDTILGMENGKKVLPYFWDGTPKDMLNTMEQLMQLQFDTVIPGHYEIIGKDDINYDINYLKMLLNNANYEELGGIYNNLEGKSVEIHKKNLEKILKKKE